MTRTTPEPAPHSENLHATLTGTTLALADLSAPDPLTRRFFHGIGNSEEQPLDSAAISFLTENENLIKQPPDATSSSDSDLDFSPSPGLGIAIRHQFQSGRIRPDWTDQNYFAFSFQNQLYKR
ncbi:hypothetical protein AVEN_209222-1 [Araneus ventricosus]|uniref:Uncharacterized protein n=1 Tax=Araneus ventricosus TaxID=182803 RepID=A0A4Y2LXS1_ARAVE|nr:hypothetical protein AVEN_209222-1 [Araneus ventricosus]